MHSAILSLCLLLSTPSTAVAPVANVEPVGAHMGRSDQGREALTADPRHQKTTQVAGGLEKPERKDSFVDAVDTGSFWDHTVLDLLHRFGVPASVLDLVTHFRLSP